MTRSDRTPRSRMDAEERREAILAAAVEAFSMQPYSDVRIADLSSAAGASDALVYRYFAGKEELYAEVVRRSLADLDQRETNALANVAKHTPTRERIRLLLNAYLDHIAADPAAWAMPQRQPGAEPAVAAEIRTAAERDRVGVLRAMLAPNSQARHEYALWGFFGFVDAACLHWEDEGARSHDRWPLIEAALGALEGALGDWSA